MLRIESSAPWRASNRLPCHWVLQQGGEPTILWLVAGMLRRESSPTILKGNWKLPTVPPKQIIRGRYAGTR